MVHNSCEAVPLLFLLLILRVYRVIVLLLIGMRDKCFCVLHIEYIYTGLSITV
jgi:hypothetical protein